MMNNIQPKRRTKIADALNSLNKTDDYSLMLFTLYKMQDDPKYSTLSELCYLLDGDNLTKLLGYYGGMTITIPTLADMRLMLGALQLYRYVNMEQIDFEKALKALEGEFTAEQIKEAYDKISEVVANYEFRRD